MKHILTFFFTKLFDLSRFAFFAINPQHLNEIFSYKNVTYINMTTLQRWMNALEKHRILKSYPQFVYHTLNRGYSSLFLRLKLAWRFMSCRNIVQRPDIKINILAIHKCSSQFFVLSSSRKYDNYKYSAYESGIS